MCTDCAKCAHAMSIIVVAAAVVVLGELLAGRIEDAQIGVKIAAFQVDHVGFVRGYFHLVDLSIRHHSACRRL
jgi:hypothetical protein